ncbi:hypothetical protein MTX80_03505 [Gordonia amicalis]|nr:hypothetical protein [Gordonia amicalis]UOG22164.1 hypothetical protein MTX80_03505 [Gordonia amicalis]
MQNNFWAGERFSSLPDAQAAAVAWCQSTAGLRIHGTTAAAPAVLFDTDERAHLLPIPADYDVPIFKTVKVHRDFHASVGKALYSLPETWIGSTLDVRLDSEAVKFYHRGELVKQHPRQPAGGQSTDPNDYPADKAAYALRNISKLQATCEHHGPPYRALRGPYRRRPAPVVSGAGGVHPARPGAHLRARTCRCCLCHRPGVRCHRRAQDRLDA